MEEKIRRGIVSLKQIHPAVAIIVKSHDS